MRAAAELTPWLRWLVRPNQPPRPEAVEVVRRCGVRGAFVVGELPSVFEQFGIAVPRVEAGKLTPQQRVADAISNWLNEPSVDADVCAIALARLLDEVG